MKIIDEITSATVFADMQNMYTNGAEYCFAVKVKKYIEMQIVCSKNGNRERTDARIKLSVLFTNIYTN